MKELHRDFSSSPHARRSNRKRTSKEKSANDKAAAFEREIYMKNVRIIEK